MQKDIPGKMGPLCSTLYVGLLGVRMAEELLSARIRSSLG